MSNQVPRGGWNNFDPVSAEDRLLVAGLAADASVLLDELVERVQSSEYPAGCPAATWVSAYDDMPVPTDIGEVMLAIHQVHSRLLAAADCLRGLSVVVANRSSSFSVGVLARGATEALAKVNRVLTAPSAREVAERNLQLLLLEQEQLGKHGHIVESGGQPIPPEVAKGTVQRAADRFGVTAGPRLTRLTADLLDRGPDDARSDHGRGHYSSLSSFAHAEVDSINLFRVNSPTDVLYLPAAYAFEFVGVATLLAGLVGSDYADVFGVRGELRQRWGSTVSRVRAEFQAAVLG
jgi:hypothetical protein